MEDDKQRLLLLTQDPGLVQVCKGALEDVDHHLVEVRDIHLLPPLIKRGVDLVIVDLNLPERSLQGAAAHLAEHGDLPVLVLAASSPATWHQISRGSPLELVLEGPIEPEQIRLKTTELLEKSRFLRQRLVGSSQAIEELRQRILLIGRTPISVLITGESGTGKDVAARALHHYSDRQDKPYKPINCAAIPENLLENELFGHEKGAFTDAKGQYKGIFEQADGGTVFLDEIGEMDRAAQVRLLRVLEEREVTRIGGTTAIPVDVRLIAATNKDLQQAVAHGEFRLDLYHRLKGVELHIPPLRRRPEDIPPLIDHFVAELSRDPKFRFVGLSAAAEELLMQYDWPGNVRELRNMVQHLAYLAPQRQLEPRDLIPHLERPPTAQPQHLPVPTQKTPDQSERELIYFALLDLKREMAELRRLVEESLNNASPAPARPVYQLEEPVILPDPLEGDPLGEPIEQQLRTLREIERDAIEHTLRSVGGNRRKAAEILGMGERTLYRKLDEYGLK